MKGEKRKIGWCLWAGGDWRVGDRKWWWGTNPKCIEKAIEKPTVP